MQREIKYRGKRVDKGEWVYGSLIHLPNARNCYDCVIIPQDANLWTPLTEKYPICADKWHHIDINTKGQFTGLKDKNGNEIYEGDIVRTVGYIPNGFNMEPRKHISTVEYWNSMVNIGYRLRSSKGKTLMIKSQAMINTMQTEIIGNIYDNPELLQEVSNE